jgi:predicted nuclease of predicted toxin-antitoxin system
VKFLVDMPLSPTLAAWLREQKQDAIHAAELKLDRASDVDILARAKGESRIVVTADLDYPRLLALTHEIEPSLVLFRDGAWSDADVIARMRDILQLLTPDDIDHTIIVVERDRLRRRRLPIDRGG